MIRDTKLWSSLMFLQCMSRAQIKCCLLGSETLIPACLQVFEKRWGGDEERYWRPVPLGSVSSVLC